MKQDRKSTFLARVRSALPSLHPAERRLGEFVCEFPGELASYDAQELARLANVSKATVSRFVRRLDYANYDEARKHLAQIIEQHPGRAPAYFNLAITYVYERNVAEAMRYIRLGAVQCSPMECLNYLNDGDFDPLRNHPAFKAFIRDLYPDLPPLPPQT